jgi:hypothetical protein
VNLFELRREFKKSGLEDIPTGTLKELFFDKKSSTTSKTLVKAFDNSKHSNEAMSYLDSSQACSIDSIMQHISVIANREARNVRGASKLLEKEQRRIQKKMLNAFDGTTASLNPSQRETSRENPFKVFDDVRQKTFLLTEGKINPNHPHHEKDDFVSEMELKAGLTYIGAPMTDYEIKTLVKTTEQTCPSTGNGEFEQGGLFNVVTMVNNAVKHVVGDGDGEVKRNSFLSARNNSDNVASLFSQNLLEVTTPKISQDSIKWSRLKSYLQKNSQSVYMAAEETNKTNEKNSNDAKVKSPDAFLSTLRTKGIHLGKEDGDLLKKQMKCESYDHLPTAKDLCNLTGISLATNQKGIIGKYKNHFLFCIQTK